VKPARTVAVAVLILGSSLAPHVPQSHAGGTHGAPLGETVTGADEPIPNLPGKRLVTHIVDYAPGASSAAHRHARSAFIYAYVISGEIRSQVDGEPARVYRAGEAWFENPALIIGSAPTPVTPSRRGCSPCSSSMWRMSS
jgi:quercetin dioxygenase-like cupin family protein